MADFRPISLCSVSYKLVTKVLTNRIKRVLSTTISLEQSPFVPNRLITNNMLVAFETLHTIRRKTISNTCLMGLKLDMSKAYDRIEWGFLEAMMVSWSLAIRL